MLVKQFFTIAESSEKCKITTSDFAENLFTFFIFSNSLLIQLSQFLLRSLRAKNN